MRVNNKSTIPLFNFFIYLVSTGIFVGIFLYVFSFEYFIHPAITPGRLMIVSVISVIALIILTPTQFEYISESDSVIIRRTNSSLWGKITGKRPNTLQFKKENLKGFKIRKNMFFRILDIYLYKPENIDKSEKISFRMAFLEKKQVSNLKNSLHKIIRKNDKTKTTEVSEKV